MESIPTTILPHVNDTKIHNESMDVTNNRKSMFTKYNGNSLLSSKRTDNHSFARHKNAKSFYSENMVRDNPSVSIGRVIKDFSVLPSRSLEKKLNYYFKPYISSIFIKKHMDFNEIEQTYEDLIEDEKLYKKGYPARCSTIFTPFEKLEEQMKHYSKFLISYYEE